MYLSDLQSDFCKYLNIKTILYHMQWLKEEFLGYLDEWEECVNKQLGFTPAQKKMMLLSEETRKGLRITGI